jgi:hypothetical protein
VTVPLTAEETYQALRLALKTFKRNRHLPGYYSNKLEIHLVGKLGESGVEKWLKSEGFDPDAPCRDLARETGPDFLVNEIGIEMKTWHVDTWFELGRCIRPGQMGGIQEKCAVVVWGIVDDEPDPIRVELAGWSTPDEVAETEVRRTGARKLKNHQIDVDQVRDLSELVAFLRV